jgi:hypothetical protein
MLMDELKQYLNDHKLFRLTPEMIERIVVLAYNYGNDEYQSGWNKGEVSGYHTGKEDAEEYRC